MLVTSNFKVNDVITFRLNTGEEVVAKLTEEKMDSYVVSKPLVMILQEKGPVMAPMMISADWKTTPVNIYKHGVTMSASTVKEIKKAYLETTSGLDLSESTII